MWAQNLVHRGRVSRYLAVQYQEYELETTRLGPVETMAVEQDDKDRAEERRLVRGKRWTDINLYKIGSPSSCLAHVDEITTL